MATKTQLVIRVGVYALALLSIAAGIPKIMQMSQELAFLSSIGLSGIAVSVLGVVQFGGGIMLFWFRCRLVGALFAGLALLVSSVALLVGGNATFGLISFLPFVGLVVVFYVELKRGRRNAA